MSRIIVLACFCLAVMACARLPREPVPVDRVFDAKIAGMPSVRAWGGILSQDFQSDLVESHRQESPGQFPLDEHGLPIYDALALSGGGASGAYGAGYLNGWTTTGSRPDFKLVTGISTGALTAPMAFLGQQYDAQLKAVFTSVDTDNILKVFNPIRIIYRNESIASTGPLEKLIDANYDEDFIRKVAARHNQGYRLYIGTHHMDAQRLVVWNMGLIANSGHPDAVKLFRKVVLASASIPIAFPPVMIESEVDGESYDEMHVDGGISVQVFFYAGTVDVTAAISDAASEELKEHPRNKGVLYVIRNGKLSSEPKQIPRDLKKITSRTVDSMIKISAVGDLYRMYSFTQRHGMDFFYTSVPEEFVSESKETFDKEEMKRLFDSGFKQGASGEGWQTEPPGF